MKIHCFLINAARLKLLEQHSNQTQNTTTSNATATNTLTGSSNSGGGRGRDRSSGSFTRRILSSWSSNSDKTRRTKITNESLKSISEESAKMLANAGNRKQQTCSSSSPHRAPRSANASRFIYRNNKYLWGFCVNSQNTRKVKFIFFYYNFTKKSKSNNRGREEHGKF